MTGIQAMVRQMQAAHPPIPSRRNTPSYLVAEIFAMRRAGQSFQQISDKTGVSYDKVRYTLR